jgi:uncharacterized membrane protein YfcA
MYATLIGAGGGFVLVPMLLLLDPQVDPDTVAGISLAVVFVNALSGSIAYGRLGRIDFQVGKLFSLVAIPGAILGALATGLFARGIFDVVFGAVLLLSSGFLFLAPGGERGAQVDESGQGVSRTVVAGDGRIYTYSYSPEAGCALSFAGAFLSSMLGIGGGIVQVPLLVRFLKFPTHIATATSQLIVALISFWATLVHAVRGDLGAAETVSQGVPLALGVAVGAQLGAYLSGRVRGPALIRFLSLGLGFAGVRLLLEQVL